MMHRGCVRGQCAPHDNRTGMYGFWTENERKELVREAEAKWAVQEPDVPWSFYPDDSTAETAMKDTTKVGKMSVEKWRKLLKHHGHRETELLPNYPMEHWIGRDMESLKAHSYVLSFGRDRPKQSGKNLMQKNTFPPNLRREHLVPALDEVDATRNRERWTAFWMSFDPDNMKHSAFGLRFIANATVPLLAPNDFAMAKLIVSRIRPTEASSGDEAVDWRQLASKAYTKLKEDFEREMELTFSRWKYVVEYIVQNKLSFWFRMCECFDWALLEREFIIGQVQQSPRIFLYYSRTDLDVYQDIAAAALTKDGSLLQFAPDAIKQNRHFVEAAVRQNGMALQYAPAHLQEQMYLVRWAVKQYFKAFQYAADSIKRDPEKILELAETNRAIVVFVKDLDAMRKVLERRPELYAMFSSGMRSQYDALYGQ